MRLRGDRVAPPLAPTVGAGWDGIQLKTNGYFPSAFRFMWSRWLSRKPRLRTLDPADIWATGVVGTRGRINKMRNIHDPPRGWIILISVEMKRNEVDLLPLLHTGTDAVHFLNWWLTLAVCSDADSQPFQIEFDFDSGCLRSTGPNLLRLEQFYDWLMDVSERPPTCRPHILHFEMAAGHTNIINRPTGTRS